MPREQICFVSYLDQDNLGIGYIASFLLQQSKHFSITLADMRESNSAVIRGIANANPIIVGFSIVTQLQLHAFSQLMSALRKNGVACHFTAGGHYPSLRYEELMQLVPELDSIVLFEGEHTMLELVDALRTGSEWRNIQGLAYRQDGKAIRTALRPLEEDLDRFPPPVRRPVRAEILGRKVVNLLAGRGCYYRCSFCSIHSFYSQPPGKIKRLRHPENVVREMQLHHEQEGVAVYLFQDDDFPVCRAEGKEWIDQFCFHLRKSGMAGQAIWKVSCRPDEVSEEAMAKMSEHGLAMVYLGIESGTPQGLKTMNKNLAPEVSLAAVEILKRLKLPFEFGFMMFDPYSTFDSVQENAEFLDRLCGDGTASIGLAKLIPLAGTRIEETLRMQNRLFGQPPYEDYRFLDPLLNDCFDALLSIFHAWMHDDRGLMNYSRWARLQIEAFRRLCNLPDDALKARETLQSIVSHGNQYLLKTISALGDLARSSSLSSNAMDGLRSEVAGKHENLCAQLNELTAGVDRLGSPLPEGDFPGFNPDYS
jgi:radical SAM superfamily enzyme YgiQ (UPF0313 family)